MANLTESDCFSLLRASMMDERSVLGVSAGSILVIVKLAVMNVTL